MTPSELARTIDSVVPPLLAALSPDQARTVDGARLAGEWEESLENLFISLEKGQVAVPAESYAALKRVADVLGMEMPPLRRA
jgi:hypothetical protein